MTRDERRRIIPLAMRAALASVAMACSLLVIKGYAAWHTGSVAMLLGGAVQGGRVQADWPGLGDAALYEGRDLRPTTALDVLIASAVSSHFALAPARTAKALFPAMTTAAAP